MAEIQDFLSKDAERQIQDLLKSLDLAEQGYKRLGKSINIAAAAQKKNLDSSIKLDGQFKNGSLARKEVIAANKESIRVNQAIVNTQAKLNQAYSVENQRLAKKRAALNKTNKELRDNAKRSLEVEARTKAGIKNADKLTGSYDKLSRELAENRKLAKDIGITYGENSKEFKEAQKNVSELDEKFKSIDSTLGLHQRKVGQYENAIDELSRRFPALGTFMTAYNASAKGAVGVTGKMSAAVKALSITIKSAGIIGLVAVVAGAAFKFLQLKNSIDESRESVANLTGETGKAADVITSKVSAIASTYEKDFNDVLRSANTLSKELGITVPEALNAIGDGFATGADANGEFLEKLKEYPAQFSAAGLSARESIAIISQEVKSGVYSDKGVDAIKEATIRIREMTPATKEAIDAIGLSSDELETKLREGSISYFDAIQMVSKQLGELPPQSVEVGTALADIFGGPGEDAGLNYITLLGDINTDLDQLKESSNEYQKTQERIRESNERISLTFNQLFGSSNNFFSSVKANALDFVANFLERSIKAGVGLVNFFIDLYNEASAFRGIIEVGKATFASFFNLINLGIENTIEAFKGLGSIVKAVLTGEFGSIGDIVSDSLGQIKDNAKEFAEETAKEYATAYKNTLSKEKVAFVNLDNPRTVESAKQAGTKAGEEYASSFNEAKKSTEELTKDEEKATESDAGLKAYFKAREKYYQDAADNLKEINTARIAAQIAANKEEINEFENLQKILLETGKITQEEYTQILFDAQKDRIAKELEGLKAVIDSTEASEKAKYEARKKYADLSIELNDIVTDAQVKAAQEAADKEKLIQETKKAVNIALIEGTADILNDIADNANERRQADLDRELERATTANDQETESLIRQKESGLITEQQYATKKEAIDKDLAKKERAIKIKKFESDKDAALKSAGINIATGILKTIATSGFPAAIPLIAALGIAGAFQVAAIASQPTPAFAEGVRGFEGGRALVGEKGREILSMPGIGVALADRPMILDLPRGTDVFKNSDTEKMLSQGQRAPKDSIDISALITSNKDIVEAIKNKPVTIINARKGKITDRRSSGQREYYNRIAN